jgi:putative RecB family exonuclease
MATYSYSRLTTFEQCPLKFKFRYIDRIIPKIEKSFEAHLGKVVHSSLEWLYTQVKENKIPGIDELISEYINNWQEEYSPEMINNTSLTPEDYLNKGIQFLTTYYTQNHPFDDNTIEVEKEIIVELDGKEHKILGFIDRLAYNIQTGEYEIHDYKTANNPPSKEKLEKDRQLALYSLAIKSIYGQEKEVKMVWHFLAYNTRVSIKKTNQELDQLKKETLELINKIESTKEFSPCKSPLCNWCEYKPICPAWGNAEINKYPTLKKYIKE